MPAGTPGRGGPRPTRRAALRAVGAATLGALLARATGARPAVARPAVAQERPSGVVAVPRAREIALIQADGSGERVALALPPGEFVADVALSPDGALVAFGRFNTPAGGGAGGSDILVAPTDGGAPPRLVAERDAPGTLLAAPYFVPDGSALVFEVIGISAAGVPTVRTDLVQVDGGGRRTLVDSARYASLSADGRQLVYVKSQVAGDAVWTRPLDGGPERQVLSEQDLLLVAYPRFRPDGSTIVLAGVGESTRSPAKLLVPGDGPPRVGVGADRARSVAAHGLPVDPWLVQANGANLRRLAQVSIDDGTVAWSPDGRWVALGGADGVRVLSADDGSQAFISEVGIFGAIDWR